MHTVANQSNTVLIWSSVSAASIELVTIVARVLSGTSAEAFNRAHDLPWFIAMHHMFWGIPAAVAAVVVMRRSRTWSMRMFGLAAGLVASDLAHHLIVLPLWTGTTGWHWP